jgi:hypothetical protein
LDKLEYKLSKNELMTKVVNSAIIGSLPGLLILANSKRSRTNTGLNLREFEGYYGIGFAVIGAVLGIS